MRNALLISVFSGLLAVAGSDVVLASGTSSIYAIPVTGQSNPDESPGLVPTGYDDQQLSPQVSQPGRQLEGPQASVVEAIPTPTAFHAGGFLLLLIFLGRCFRKLRWA